MQVRLFLMLIFLSGMLSTAYPWKETNLFEISEMQEPKRYGWMKNCKDNGYCFFDHKRKSENDVSSNGNQFGSICPGGCCCNGKEELKDLGAKYYPRYLPSMDCTAGGCGKYYSCNPKFFTYHVIRRELPHKTFTANDANERLCVMQSSAGGSEYYIYIKENITITVGCECK